MVLTDNVNCPIFKDFPENFNQHISSTTCDAAAWNHLQEHWCSLALLESRDKTQAGEAFIKILYRYSSSWNLHNTFLPMNYACQCLHAPYFMFRFEAYL